MKKLLAMIGLVSALSQPAFAQLQTTAVDIWASGYSTFATPAVVTLDSTGNLVPTVIPSNGGTPYTPVTFTNASSGKSLTINLTQLEVDTDPHLQFAFGVSNPDGASGLSSYSFTFATANTTNLNLTPGQYSVSSSIGVTLTAGGDDPSVPVTMEPPTLPPPATGTGAAMQSYFGVGSGSRIDAGVDILNNNLTFTPSVTGSDTDTFAQVQSPTLTYNLNSTQTQISVTTSFLLSNSDSASVSGRFNVALVPEPSEDAMLLAGLGALFLAVRRRWRSH
jgi:hypothetical protein